MNHTRPRQKEIASSVGQNSSQSDSRSKAYADRLQYPGVCTAVIGSMTQALKAQALLADASVRTSVTKLSSTKHQTGCVYGLDFPCLQKPNVTRVLSDGGISVRGYLGGD